MRPTERYLQRAYDKGLVEGQNMAARSLDRFFTEEAAKAPNGLSRKFIKAVWQKSATHMRRDFSHIARPHRMSRIISAFLNGAVGGMVVMCMVLLGWFQ